MSQDMRVLLALMRLVVGEADATAREEARDRGALVVCGELVKEVDEDEREAA